jgi:hypothetical protein
MNPKAMPFDGRRMIYGGFKSLVDSGWVAASRASRQRQNSLEYRQ